MRRMPGESEADFQAREAAGKRRVGRPSTFGWSRLREVGDALVVLGEEAACARAAASAYKARYPGWDYASEKLPDGRVQFTRK